MILSETHPQFWILGIGSVAILKFEHVSIVGSWIRCVHPDQEGLSGLYCFLLHFCKLYLIVFPDLNPRWVTVS